MDIFPRSESTPLLLSEEEERVLELYDRLQQLQLEVALITAQKDYVPGQVQPGDIETVQNSLLESRAQYVLQQEVAENIMMVNPILQAVHGGTNASPIERDLLPVLTERDKSSTSLAQQSFTRGQSVDEILQVQADSLRLSQQNVELAEQVLSLAEQANRNKIEVIADPDRAQEITRLESEVKASRQRWRVMKATASAMVAGSGVDWAADEALRAIVLDDDGDGV